MVVTIECSGTAVCQLFFSNKRILILCSVLPSITFIFDYLVNCKYNNNLYSTVSIVGRGRALVELIAFNRRVVGSTPALAPHRDLGQVLYLQSPVRFRVKLQCSICAVVGSSSE